MKKLIKMCVLFQVLWLASCSLDEPEAPRKPIAASPPPVQKIEAPAVEVTALSTNLPLKVAAGQPGSGPLFAYFAEHPENLEDRDEDQ